MKFIKKSLEIDVRKAFKIQDRENKYTWWPK